MAPANEDEGDKICVELASLRFQKRNNEHGHAYRVCQILLYCVFPGSGMLGLERADQDLTVTGSDGMELEITRWEGPACWSALLPIKKTDEYVFTSYLLR